MSEASEYRLCLYAATWKEIGDKLVELEKEAEQEFQKLVVPTKSNENELSCLCSDEKDASEIKNN